MVKYPRYVRYDGVGIFNPMFKLENIVSATDFPLDADDIVIATYPKCGTTWTEHIIRLIIHQGKDLPEASLAADRVPFVELDGKEDAVKRAKACLTIQTYGHTIVKTHLSYDVAPKHPDAKIIFVTRNPKDCLVSFFHHTRNLPFYEFEEGDFSTYFELFLKGNVDFGDYFDYLAAWYPHREDDNLLFLRYEAIKNNPQREVMRIAKFLGEGYERSLRNTNTMQLILDSMSFNSMKKEQHKFFPIPGVNFIRKGDICDWRNHFTQEQSDRMDAKISAWTSKNPKCRELYEMWLEDGIESDIAPV